MLVFKNWVYVWRGDLFCVEYFINLIHGVGVLICAGKSKTSRTIIAIVVPAASVVLVVSLFCIYLRARKPRKKIESKSN